MANSRATQLTLPTPRFNYVAAAEENPWLQELDLEDGLRQLLR